jgi:Xaa-Pro aminopeptidase
MSEYPPDRFKRREWISRFTGSAGSALVTTDQALLWTDGRYFLQAEQELPAGWTLMRAGTGHCPEVRRAAGGGRGCRAGEGGGRAGAR